MAGELEHERDMSDLEVEEPNHSRPRLLYVDDEPASRAALPAVLEATFSVATSENATEALSRLEQDGDFAVVLADVRVPAVSGLRFLELMKEASPTTARVALTDLDVALLPKNTLFRVLTKPCPPELLLKTLEDALAYHRLIVSSPFQPVEAPQDVPASAPRESPAPRAGAPLGEGVLLDPSPAAPQRAPGIPIAPVRGGRIGLRVRGRTIELLPGRTVLGRSRSCHIALNDPKVSRRHACFSSDGHELTVRNSSATNPLLVNGVALTDGTRALKAGDHIKVGSHEIEVCLVGDYSPSLEPTERMSLHALKVDPLAWDDAASLVSLARVAEKYLRLHQGREAERILRPPLEGLLRHCRGGRAPLSSDVQLAVQLALDLAEANRAGSWITFVFELLSAIERPAEEDILERLYRVVPVTPGIRITTFRSYLDALMRCQARFSPADRFLVRRAQGLLSAVMRSAHV